MVSWRDSVISAADLPTQAEVSLVSRHFKMVKFLPLNQQIASLRQLGNEHSFFNKISTEQWYKASGYNYLQNSKLLENAPLMHICMLLQEVLTHAEPEVLLRHSCRQFLPNLVNRFDQFVQDESTISAHAEVQCEPAFA